MFQGKIDATIGESDKVFQFAELGGQKLSVLGEPKDFGVSAPGSEINIVWKQAILNSDEQIINDYFENLKNTFAMPQTNSISIKVLYYLDYLSLKKTS